MPNRQVWIGCAGWAIPATNRAIFPPAGSQLERYAAVFPAVEINSSFYRPHRATTYARWANTVPDDFRFSVKVPKAITHEARLVGAESTLARFVEDCSHLGTKLGCLLVQLPPSLVFDGTIAGAFLHSLRQATGIAVCCEPRHSTWLSDEAQALFHEYEVARVIADPSPFPFDPSPAAADRLVYHRLHGSPRMYYSSYSTEFLAQLVEQLRDESPRTHHRWCIFDNTAAGAATSNALALLDRMSA